MSALRRRPRTPRADQNGRHTDTKLLPSGATRYHFTYTPDGLLSSVVDGYGNVTQVQRAGDTTTITSAFGVATTLTLGSDGRPAPTP